MKLILRILLILLSITLWVFAFLPPSPSEAPASGPEDAIAPTATPAHAHSLVSDMLGAKQIHAGQKARDQLDKVKAQRDAELKELE